MAINDDIARMWAIDEIYLYRIKNAINELEKNNFGSSLSDNDIELLNKHIKFLKSNLF